MMRPPRPARNRNLARANAAAAALATGKFPSNREIAGNFSA